MFLIKGGGSEDGREVGIKWKKEIFHSFFFYQSAVGGSVYYYNLLDVNKLFFISSTGKDAVPPPDLLSCSCC